MRRRRRRKRRRRKRRRGKRRRGKRRRRGRRKMELWSICESVERRVYRPNFKFVTLSLFKNRLG